MGQPIPAQHPSVVLRSHFKLVRGLLAIAMAAVLALAAVVVILANDEDEISSTTKATPAVQAQNAPGTRYDGGPDEGTRGATSVQPQAIPGTRYDGGPEEGTRSVSPAPSSIAAGSESAYESLRSSGTRYDGGPEEGSRGAEQPQFKERAGGPNFIHEGR
jgi:hypothetical protein